MRLISKSILFSIITFSILINLQVSGKLVRNSDKKLPYCIYENDGRLSEESPISCVNLSRKHELGPIYTKKYSLIIWLESEERILFTFIYFFGKPHAMHVRGKNL